MKAKTTLELKLIRFLLLLLLVSTTDMVLSKEIVGWTEKTVIYPGGLEMRAKLDTGAKTSSLNCECQNFIDKDGEKWVRFSVINYQGERIWIEKKIHRMVKIKRHFGNVQERPVIILGICLGDVYRETEVNVINRSGLKYPMLIGRQFLKGEFLVDSGAQFINPPRCEVKDSE